MQKTRKFSVPFAAPRFTNAQAQALPQDGNHLQHSAQGSVSNEIGVQGVEGEQQETADLKTTATTAPFRAPSAASKGGSSNVPATQRTQANLDAKGSVCMRPASTAATSQPEQQVWSCLYVKAGGFEGLSRCIHCTA
jgi:hypothetical protein